MAQDTARKATRITDGTDEATIERDGDRGRLDTRDEQIIVLLSEVLSELHDIKALLAGAL